jgi:hypothetical protein
VIKNYRVTNTVAGRFHIWQLFVNLKMEQPNNQETAEKLRVLAEQYYHPIWDIVEKGHLQSWFRAYMKSHEFETLSAEWKVESFDALYGLEKYITAVFEVIDKTP